jgi:hypothetical protein
VYGISLPQPTPLPAGHQASRRGLDVPRCGIDDLPDALEVGSGRRQFWAAYMPWGDEAGVCRLCSRGAKEDERRDRAAIMSPMNRCVTRESSLEPD